MIQIKRIFLIVLDSVGIGEMDDAEQYGDKGCSTIRSISRSKEFVVPVLTKMGFLNIDFIGCGEKEALPIASFGRLREASKGKDTTIGHWEIAGIESKDPLPTYPNGFPKEIIDEFENKTGKKVICNKPYSGTDVIRDYGQQHLQTGDLIIYTSADSVFQIAAHEEIVPIGELYGYCEIAREILKGKHGVGRVIARPFLGEAPNFKRTSNRHDYSLNPPEITMLDQLKEEGLDVISIGKISDIFNGRGITKAQRTKNNSEGIELTIKAIDENFEGLCFTNLVDFDMVYGHRNDIDGYAKALSEFDKKLPEIISKLKEDDILIITADHGCDPGDTSTDHTREYVPLIVYGKKVKKGINLNTRSTFSDIGSSILDYFNIDTKIKGQSFLKEVLNRDV